MEITLTYLGNDSWDRPVYQEGNKKLWKDVEPLSDREANLCSSVNNQFDGEPDIHMTSIKKYQNAIIKYVPQRIVWR